MLPLLVFAVDAFAQSSLGLGRSEQAIKPDGMFAGILFWIQQQQQAFYRAMTGVLSAMKNEPGKVWYLVGLSFAYGVFHAAGPGHGKAVVSSYMLANEVAAKRGIALSFAASLMQGVTAIVVIAALLLFLRQLGLRSDNLAGYLEITSYFLVMVLGGYLLWAKITGKGHHHHHEHDGHCDHGHHDHGDGGCGHMHMADPSKLGERTSLKEIWSVILAVGLRPCSGAIIVLTFAFLNGLYLGGILSTFAMSIGTGITVSALALLAVSAKNVAMRIAGVTDRAGAVHRVIEIAGAGLVFLLGLLLFSAAISV